VATNNRNRTHASRRSIGRIKLLLGHIEWPRVAKALGQEKPIKVTIALTNAKGGPVFASVGPNIAKWSP
jgi:hypothetical protein